MQCLADHAGAGGAEGVAVGNGAAVHVELAAVDFAKGGEAGLAAHIVVIGQPAQVAGHLAGKGFVHVHQGQVAERQPGPGHGGGGGQHRAHEQVILGCACREGVGADIAQRGVTQGGSFLLAHHQQGAGAVGERAAVASGDRTGLTVEHRLEFAVALALGLFAHQVVVLEGVAVGEMGGHYLTVQTAFGPGAGGVAVGSMGQIILLLTADAPLLHHFLGALTHGFAHRVFGDGRRLGQQVAGLELAEQFDALFQGFGKAHIAQHRAQFR